VKGKKRPAGLVALVADLKGARDELRSEIENLDLDEPISTAAWATAAEWTSQEHVDALAGQVTPARREFEAGIQRLLGSKAL
jgi:hypothetical protein